MAEIDLQALADRLTGGATDDDPQRAASPEAAALSPDELRGLASLLVIRRCFRIARALLEGLRDRDLMETSPAVQGPLDVVNALCDLSYGSSKEELGSTPGPLPAMGDGDDEVVTAVRSRGQLGEDFSTFDEAKTGRWTFKVPLAELIATAGPGGFLGGADEWFNNIADASRAINDGKCKLARALLDGLSAREPGRPEPVAAHALLALAEGRPAAGMTLLEDARGRLGTHPSIERTAVLLAPHVASGAAVGPATRPAVDGLIGLLSGIAVELLSSTEHAA
jgi:hypothetical protein